MREEKVWLEISAGALEENLRTLRHTAVAGLPARGALQRSPAMLAVIKADGYGHGAVLCAPVLARAGAEWLGVTDAREGAAVRVALLEAGIVPDLQPDVLVMCGLQPGDAPLILAHRLTPVVWFPEQLIWLEAAAVDHFAGSTPPSIPLHVEIDTGMSRQGVPPGAPLGRLLDRLRNHPHLRLTGVLTHFSSAEIARAPATALQADRFARAVAGLQSAGMQPKWLHAGNTATLDEQRLLPWLLQQAEQLDARLLCRTGLGLFGYTLPLQGATPAAARRLHPVAAWKTRVIAVSEVAAGEHVGYNAAFTARQPMRLALLPVGYADGLRRELSSSDTREGGAVLIRGERAPIVGRISMNLTTVDITGMPAAGLGEEVTLLGPGVSAEEHARVAGTLSYEILCGLRGARQLVL